MPSEGYVHEMARDQRVIASRRKQRLTEVMVASVALTCLVAMSAILLVTIGSAPRYDSDAVASIIVEGQ